jgi:hypothetical protein
MTFVPKAEIAAIRIDRDQDIIPVSVGLYRLFMAGGTAGREALALYQHLIFTARLQDTQQVKANNVYLGRGLDWGQAKVKAAKAWLADAQLIEYVRTRAPDGHLGEVYIRLRFAYRMDAAAAPAQEAPETVPADAEDYQDDLTPDLFADEESETTGSEIDPLGTTGSVIHPVVDHTHGARRQMLKIKKEMLEEKKGKEEAAPVQDFESDLSDGHLEMASLYYRRFSKETGQLISPRVDDYKTAKELFDAIGGNLGDFPAALDAYFGNFKAFWFAVTKATAKKSDAEKRPEWSFRIFCTRYPEIVAAAKSMPALSGAAPVAGLRFAHLFAAKEGLGA